MSERRDRIVSLNNLGSEAFSQGQMKRAVALYEQATALMTPADDDLAGPIYENLGLARLNLGTPRPASRALLRALDGRMDRPQSLSFLTVAFVRMGDFDQARRWLAHTEARLGAHPGGLTLAMLDQAQAQAAGNQATTHGGESDRPRQPEQGKTG